MTDRTAELRERPAARDGYDPNGWATMLTALRNANDGFVLTVWNKSENGDAGYKVWRTLDGQYAECDPGFAMNIPIHELCGELDKAIREQPAMSSGGAELPKAAALAARDDVIEECAQVAMAFKDEPELELVQFSPQFVHGCTTASVNIAHHIRALKAASSPVPDHACHQFHVHGGKWVCKDCGKGPLDLLPSPAPRSDNTDALKAEIVKWRTACEVAETEAEAAKDRAEEHATRRVNAETQRDQCERMLLAARVPRSDAELREIWADEWCKSYPERDRPAARDFALKQCPPQTLAALKRVSGQ